MSHVTVSLCHTLILITGLACEDPHHTQRTRPDDSSSLDGEVDGQLEAGVVSELDQGSAGTAGAEIIGGEPQGGGAQERCLWPSDCPDGDCVEGSCGAHLGACRLHTDCPAEAACFEGRCVRACTYDSDCAERGMCVEGSCHPTPDGLLDGGALPSLSQEGELLVGVGVYDLDYPLGVSLAGFGARPGPRTPYSRSLGGSHSVWERQDVRAVALDEGGQVTLLIRLPLAWSTDLLRSHIALELSALLNERGQASINPLDHLLIFATHSHSQPARFWNLAPQLNFGALGYGTFSPSLTRAYARSAAHAALSALDDRRPARVGWRILDEADPERRIHSNRRSHANDVVDDRLLALKFEALTGDPIVAMVGFGVHGTHLMSPLVSGDVAGVIERHFTEQLSAKVGQPTPVIFMNGNAGNLSPRGDHVTTKDLGHLQVVASLLWSKYEPLIDDLQWEAEPTVKHKAWRVPIGYDVLGYDDAPEGFLTRSGEPQRLGAFACVNDERGPDEAPYSPPDIPCGVIIHSVYQAPVMQFQKTVLSALRVGSLLLTTMPGEPVSELGLRLAELVEEDGRRAGLAEARSFNIGYAQDHHFYLLREDDWLRGGYESRMGLWGWREGEHLIQQASALSAHLLGLIELPEYTLSPTWWPAQYTEEIPREPSAQPTPELLTQPATLISRSELAVVRWRGGDPAVDRPKVSLWSIEEEGDASEARHPASGLPLNDQGLESVTRYEGDYDGAHQWSTRWDLPLELPVGRYFIRVEGQASQPYRLESSPFTLTGRGGLLLHGRFDEPERLTLSLTYAPGPSNDDGGVLMTRSPTGSVLRLLSPLTQDDERLSTSDGALKRWRYLIGPPPLATLTVSLYPSSVELNEEGYADQPPLAQASVEPVRGSCALTLVSARDERGTESHVTLEGRLCGQVELDSTALSVDGAPPSPSQKLVIHDQAGTWLELSR